MNTYTLINVVKLLYPVVMFFKNRYFPDGQAFYSEDVIIEMMRGNKKIAPFIVPYLDGIPQEKAGYEAYKYTAPYIGLSTVITPKDLKNKAFGEDPNSNRSDADRRDELEADYSEDMRNKILRTMELMCIEILMTGKLHIKQYATAEDVGSTKFVPYDIQFYNDSFKNQYVPDKLWSSMTIQEKIQTLNAMARILKKRGITATDVVLGANVSTDLFSDPSFLKYFDYKSVDFGSIAPEETPEGVTYNGTINILGVKLSFFSYDEEYQDLSGNDVSFIPPDAIFLLKPNMGETPYGEVTFFDKDGNVESHAEKFVPREVPDANNNKVTIELYSRPLPYPKDPESWLYFDTTTVATE